MPHRVSYGKQGCVSPNGKCAFLAKRQVLVPALE